MEKNIEIIVGIIKKYCVPNKEHDGIQPRQVAEEILKSLIPVDEQK